jgi:hypothetical protein
MLKSKLFLCMALAAPLASEALHPILLGQSVASNKAAFVLSAVPPPKYDLLFSDDFGGSVLDQTKWVYRTGAPYFAALLPEEVSVKDGHLEIATDSADFAGKKFATGGVISQDRFRYGYYSVQFKVTANPGWHTSFWLMSTDSHRRTEIDGFEIESPRVVSSGIITYDAQGVQNHQGTRCNRSYDPGYSMADGYHIFGFEWTEDKVTYYIDNKPFCTQSYPATQFTHDAGNIWLTSVGYRGKIISVDKNPSPNGFGKLAYYVRDYYINAHEPGYGEYGAGWHTDSLLGFSALATRSSSAPDAVAQWVPTIVTPGSYDVQIWKTQSESSDPAAPVTIHHRGATARSTIDLKAGKSGWVDLGTFEFASGSSGSVTLGSSGKGITRASMVKFVRR